MAFAPVIDTANQLVDMDTIRAFINAQTDSVAQEKILKFYINTASWTCNSYTRRLLKSRALTEYYSGDGTNILLMNNYPITALTNIYDDLDRSYGSDTEITTTDLAYMPDRLAYQLIYVGGVFTKGTKNIKAEYTAGYVTIPWDLQQACLEVIAYFFKNSEENRFGVTSRTIGDGSLSIETTDVPKSAIRILDNYKRKW